MTATEAKINWTEKTGIWTVHSSVDKRPALRGFAKSRPDAEALMATMKAQEPASSTATYWLVELARGELEDFRSYGMLPPGY